MAGAAEIALTDDSNRYQEYQNIPRKCQCPTLQSPPEQTPRSRLAQLQYKRAPNGFYIKFYGWIVQFPGMSRNTHRTAPRIFLFHYIRF